MRKGGIFSLIWGGFLIVLGLALLAENFGWLGDWNAPFWSLILGAVSLLFLVTYITDREQWWALIPGLTMLVIAVAVFLAEQDLIAGHVVATLILAGVSLPFLVIFAMDREHWWALIPGLTMAGIALAVLMEGIGLVSGEAVGGLAVGSISLSFLSIYLLDREQWWALFPGGIMAIIAFFLLLATAAEYVWPLVLILLGLLLLRGSLGGGRRKPRRRGPESPPSPPPPAAPERQRPPTLEEQIEKAIAEEAEEETSEETPTPDDETTLSDPSATSG